MVTNQYECGDKTENERERERSREKEKCLNVDDIINYILCATVQYRLERRNDFVAPATIRIGDYSVPS